MITLACFALLAFYSPAPQSRERVLQPHEYNSLSGNYTLRVEPSQRDGEGAMHCRLKRGQDELWSADFPWTFETAGVAEDGTVVGYRNGDELRIAVLDSKGALRKEHKIEHTVWIVDGPALPMASGDVLVHSTAGLACVRVHPADQSRPSPWKAIRLADGEFADDVLPAYPIALAEGQSLYERDARVIGETGLTLCHWWALDFRRDDVKWAKDGCVFSLVDLHGQTTWRLPLLDDYTDRRSEKDSEALSNSMEWKPVILSTGPGNRFAVWEVKARVRVEFDVQKDEVSGWRVVEVGRASYPPKPPTPPAVESIELKLLGRTSLVSKAEKALDPIHDVYELGFTSAGEIEIFRHGRSGAPSYARLTPAGALLFERDLAALFPAKGGWPEFHKLSGDRWLVELRGEHSTWFELDVKTGEKQDRPFPDTGLGVSIAPQSDGSYLAVFPENDGGAGVTELAYVNADGSFSWRERVCGLGPDDTDFQKTVSFAQGVASVGGGRFVVLDMNELVTIDTEKRVLRSKKIADLIGHEPIYANDLRSDCKGGVCFNEGDRIWHVDAQGSLAGSLAPRLSDGSEGNRLESLVRFAPDGRAWTSDSARIYRLDDRGVADQVLGTAPKREELEHPGEFTIDVRGRTLVCDEMTQAVHVFDSQGKRLFVCSPENAERCGGLDWHSLHIGRDGTIHMAIKDGVASFDTHGERLSKRIAKADDLDSTWKALDQADPDLRALYAIEKRPDGTWFESASERALAPDGTRILLDSATTEAGGATLYLYSPKGEFSGTVALPEENGLHSVSASSRWIIAGTWGPKMLLVRASDHKVFRFKAGTGEDSSPCIGQTPDGRVLLVVDQGSPELLRYELP
jgi:hypothetical protein